MKIKEISTGKVYEVFGTTKSTVTNQPLFLVYEEDDNEIGEWIWKPAVDCKPWEGVVFVEGIKHGYAMSAEDYDLLEKHKGKSYSATLYGAEVTLVGEETDNRLTWGIYINNHRYYAEPTTDELNQVQLQLIQEGMLQPSRTTFSNIIKMVSPKEVSKDLSNTGVTGLKDTIGLTIVDGDVVLICKHEATVGLVKRVEEQWVLTTNTKDIIPLTEEFINKHSIRAVQFKDVVQPRSIVKVRHIRMSLVGDMEVYWKPAVVLQMDDYTIRLQYFNKDEVELQETLLPASEIGKMIVPFSAEV